MRMSREEADKFLTEVLGLSPEYTKSKGVSLLLLDAIILNFQQRIPFQSVTSCAVPQDQRHLPSWDEIKECCISGRGGLCYQLNVFMKVLLEALGYDASLASGAVKELNDHVTVVVSHLQGTGSHYLVEVGCGYPTFRTVPLDFADESPEYVSGFLRHKFVRKNDAVIWYHEPRGKYRPICDTDLTPDGWYRFVEIRAFTPCDVELFESTMTTTFTDPREGSFLQVPTAVSFSSSKLIAIKGNQYIIEEGERRVCKIEIDSLDKLLEIYLKHFPQLPLSVVSDAIRNSGLKF